VKYTRVDWKVETASILILLFQFYLIQNHSSRIAVIYLILSCFVYLILSIVMHYSVSPNILFKKLENPELYGRKSELTETELLIHIKRGITYTSFFKLCFLLIPLLVSFTSVFGYRNTVFNLLLTIILIALAFLMFYKSMQYFSKARGFTEITFRQILTVGLFYYNTNDSRAIVDKQFGIGSTINLASKEGRLVLWIILAIPVTIITLLLIAFRLSGKL